MRIPPGRWVFFCLPCELPPEARWRTTGTAGRQPAPAPRDKAREAGWIPVVAARALPALCPRSITCGAS